MTDGTDLRFRKISTDDGLSQTRVERMVQDDRGFMWFGTQYGLNRFDGYSFKVFSHDPERRGSLSGVFITVLFKDRAGVIWVGCNQFLDRFDPVSETFTHYKLAADRPGAAVTVTHISQDSDGILWLATGKGLYRFDPATGRSTRYVNDPNNTETISRNDIKTTGEDRSGSFWVATSAGLDRFDRATGKVNLHISLPASSAGLRFHEDRHGNFWVLHGADSRLSLLDLRSNTLTEIDLSEPGDPRHRDSFSSMIEDRDGVMWFGTTRNGLLKFDRVLNRLVRYRSRPDDPDSLASNTVLTLLQDREGNIWTGLQGSGPNFCSLLPLMFHDLSKIPGKGAPPGLTTVLHLDASGRLWVGAGGVLRQLDRETGQASDFMPTKGYDVLTIVEQTPDRVWYGTSGGGIIRYDPKTRRSVRYMPTNAVERMLIARDGALWAATWSGLHRYDPAGDRFVAFRPDQQSRGLNFHSIAEGGDGKLWLGSNLGLYRFDPVSGQFTSYSNDPDDAGSVSDNRINSIYFDRSGTMWLGTQNGLDIFDPATQKFRAYYRRDGLPGNVISCIQEDRLHVLWMSTNNGISRFDPRKGSFRNYNVADGLPGPDLTGWAACAKSPAGEFFFGGFSGSTAFVPGNEQDSSFSPQTVLTDFRLFGEPVGISPGSPLNQSIASASSLTLSHWQNFFSFEFSALSYYNAATNRYRYRLEDLDHRWTEVVGNQRLANYTSVPPGDYTFRVQSATSRGAWGEPGVVLRVHVGAPWWSTWLFRLACVLVAALGVTTFYRFRLRQITNQLSIRFDERLAERTRIARELHDTLLGSFHGLMFLFHAARHKLPECPDEAAEVLDRALDGAVQTLSTGRNAIHGLRADPGSVADLDERIATAARELLVINGHSTAPTFRVEVAGARQPLNPIVLEEVCGIANEVLRNAARHSSAEHIAALIKFEKRSLLLRIRDNGKGIEPEILAAGGRTGHWGLLGIRERARKIGALVDIRSEPGAGTTVEVTIPGTVAYADLRVAHEVLGGAR